MLLRTPSRSSGTASGSKPTPRSRTNTETALSSISAYTSTCPVPACFAALVMASRAAATTGRRVSCIGQSPTATTSTLTPCASSTSAAAPRRALATLRSSVASPTYSQDRRSRSWARARRATVAESPELFWIRASVWSTESCRCAATSARSWVRIRSARSALRSEDSRKIHGPTTNSSPITPRPPARTASRAS